MTAKKKTSWAELAQEDRVAELVRPNDQLLAEYDYPGLTDAAFAEFLTNERALWDPANATAFRDSKGSAPKKDVILGAWRDLDRAEALLELIDNSIDAWRGRREKNPQSTADTLEVRISIDAAKSFLTYEDNAGGVSEDRLEHLVIPGFSNTEAGSATIGSYKTGGKKAVFRLARAVSITSRYWNPAGTTDDAIAVHLNETWINDSELYKFPYTVLREKGSIEKGQTRYVFRLREEPRGGQPWYSDTEELKRIGHAIRRTYSLLRIRVPEIKIYFQDLKQPLELDVGLFDFSGTNTTGVDIRPQQVVFDFDFEDQGFNFPLKIEFVLGCRTSTAGNQWGVDLYGNDRLFKAYDQDVFSELLPKSAARGLVRGFVNILGANIFIPWDTHKRHVNRDREVLRVLRGHPAVVAFVDAWKDAYNAISRSAVKETIATKLKIVEAGKRELNIPHRHELRITPSRRRAGGGEDLPPAFRPNVTGLRPDRSNDFKINLSFSTTEARALLAHYEVDGSLESKATKTQLTESIHDDILSRAVGRSISPRPKKASSTKKKATKKKASRGR